MNKIKLEALKSTLTNERNALLLYLLAKYENSDWHAVQDAASDLRDIDCKLAIIKMVDLE